MYEGLSSSPAALQVLMSRVLFAEPILSPGPTGPPLSRATAVCSPSRDYLRINNRDH